MLEQCIKRNQLDAFWTKGHLGLRHNSLNTDSNNNSGPEPDAIAKFFKKIIGFPNRIMSGRKGWELLLHYLDSFLRATRGTRNLNLQVVASIRLDFHQE